MKNKTALFLFTKAPIKGEVKKRLSNDLPEDLVLELHKFFIKKCIETINKVSQSDKYIFHYPEKIWRHFKQYENYQLLPQKGNNFNERLFSSFSALFTKSYSRVLCIGSDHPDLPANLIKKAINELTINDLVIGPAIDGGYYLIGLKAKKKDLIKKIFSISPSKKNTFIKIKRLLQREKVSFHVLPPWYDIDTIEDLKNYMKRNPGLSILPLFKKVKRFLFQERFLLLALEITSKCNLKCKHCYADANTRGFLKKELSFEQIKNIIRETKSLGFKFILITGGEPFLRSDIFRILNYASQNSLKIFLVTNGNFITPEIVKKLKKIKNLYNIKISIDGMEKTHNKIRGTSNSFKKAMESILLLKEANLNIGINMTVMKENLKDLPYVVKLARKLKVELSLKRFIPIGRGKKHSSSVLEKQEILEAFKKVKKYKKLKIKFTTDPQHNPYTSKKFQDIKNKTGGCSAGISLIAINSKGEVSPCTRLPINLGNIKDQSLFQIILNSRVLKKLEDRSNLKGKCKKCKFKMVCGGCRAYAYATTGDYLAEDSLCII